jgi:hypothetical protein
MIDWSNCPQVVSRPGYISGAPALRDDPRVPASTVIDHIDATDTPRIEDAAAEVIELFSLRTTLRDVLAVYSYAKQQEAQHAA